MPSSRKMNLGAFLAPFGHHVAAWRHPQAPAVADFNFFMDVAKTAERGLFDMMFLPDSLSAWGGDSNTLYRQAFVDRLDPHTLLTGLAALTKNIGVVCTATTTYDEPYLLARRFASMDAVSFGRAGWNLVTSSIPAEADNFSRDTHVSKGDRYTRAGEFAKVVMGLWNSFADDAFVRNKETGVFFEPDKMNVLNHEGAAFRVKGPLTVSRSPQGQPVIVLAGASDDGRDLGATVADVLFAAHPDIETARAFYSDMKRRVAEKGRDPDLTKIMPGFAFTVGSSKQHAEDKYNELQELIHPQIGLKLLSTFIQFDLSEYDVDGPLPEIELENRSSRTQLLIGIARKENLTIRELYMRIAGARGHFSMVGTAADIADKLEEWFTTGAADGFNIMPPLYLRDFEDFVNEVIPELQRRGLFRTAYEGSTLRQNLGLPVPGKVA